MNLEPVRIDDEAWALQERAARVSGVITWSTTGILLAGLLPGLPMMLLAAEVPPMAAYIVGSLVVGAFGGVLLGLLRPFERLIRALSLAGRSHMVLPLSLLVGFVLGVVWGGLAGSAGGAMVAVAFMLLEGGGTEVGFVVIGAILGAAPGWSLGGVGIAAAAAIRSEQLRRGAPWWLPAVGGAAVAVGLFAWTVILFWVLIVGLETYL